MTKTELLNILNDYDVVYDDDIDAYYRQINIPEDIFDGVLEFVQNLKD